MKEDKVDSTLVLLLSLAIVFSVGGVVLNYVLLSSVEVPVVSIAGRVTDSTSTVTLTQSGAAGIVMDDSAIAYGSGYYNSSCTSGFSQLDSNKTHGAVGGANDNRIDPMCWINTTQLLTSGADKHTIQNNGSVKVNVSAYGDQLDGETLFCGAASAAGCPFTANARVRLLSQNNEASSCTATLTSGFENFIADDGNTTTGLCDALDFQDNADTIDVYTKFTVPKDATASAKTLTITYQALAI